MSARLTPMMESALSAMTRGELQHEAPGWISAIGVDGVWNSHTLRWLASRRYCVIAGNRARITAGGRNALMGVQQGWAA